MSPFSRLTFKFCFRIIQFLKLFARSDTVTPETLVIVLLLFFTSVFIYFILFLQFFQNIGEFIYIFSRIPFESFPCFFHDKMSLLCSVSQSINSEIKFSESLSYLFTVFTRNLRTLSNFSPSHLNLRPFKLTICPTTLRLRLQTAKTPTPLTVV